MVRCGDGKTRIQSKSEEDEVMRVIHELADGLFEATDIDALERNVRKFLEDNKIPAEVGREGEDVVVSYPDIKDIDADEDERIILSFCRDRRFGKAKKVVKEWIEKVPWNSDAYRLRSQIEMENKEFDAAIEFCKHSLKLNPRNLYAMILMGNLLSRDKGWIDQGLVWFKRAYELFPESVLAVNNYAGALAQKGGEDSAKLEALFRQAIDLDPSYLNPAYALAGLLIEKNDLASAFEVVESALRNGRSRPENNTPIKDILTQMLVRLAIELSKNVGMEIVDAKRAEVKEEGGIDVEIAKDDKLGVPAKMELADRYGRDHHRLVYNPAKTQNGQAYYLLHELEKQILNIESEKAGKKAQFIQTKEGSEKLLNKTRDYVTNKLRSLLPHDKIGEFLTTLVTGIGGQLMNCPLDCIVAERLHEKCKELRPCQVVATFELAKGGMMSVISGVNGGFPKNIVKLNRTLNAVSFLQHKELLGIDFVDKLNLSSDETKLAKSLYDDFKKTMSDFRPGDEWQLVRRFLAQTKCDEYFSVLWEEEQRAEEKRKEESTRLFQQRVASGEDVALNMAITMYMVEAIKRLRSYDVEHVRVIAAEIAMLGTRGISPDKKSGYSVPSLDNEDMSGCRMLAYYYVSWKIGFPDAVQKLGLPLENEYIHALSLAGEGR